MEELEASQAAISRLLGVAYCTRTAQPCRLGCARRIARCSQTQLTSAVNAVGLYSGRCVLVRSTHRSTDITHRHTITLDQAEELLKDLHQPGCVGWCSWHFRNQLVEVIEELRGRS